MHLPDRVDFLSVPLGLVNEIDPDHVISKAGLLERDEHSVWERRFLLLIRNNHRSRADGNNDTSAA